MSGVFGLRKTGLQNLGNALKLGFYMRLILQLGNGLRQQPQGACGTAKAR